MLMVLLVTVLSSACLGLGISPAKTTIDFEPNKEASVKLRLLNNEQKAVQVVLYAKGENSSLVTFSENTVKFSAGESEKIVYAKIAFPQAIDAPGTHEIEVLALEVPELAAGGETQLRATVAVESIIIFKVPYPSQYLEGNIFVSDTEVKKAAVFSIPLYNFGSEDLKGLKAVINIYTPLNERVGTIETNTIDLEKRKEGRLSAEWIADVNPGEYYASATIYYADKKLELKATFKVGNFELAINKIEVQNFRLGEIAKFNIFVENKWNKPVAGVYADVTISSMDGTELTSSKTASVDIQPGLTEKLLSYWDTAGVSVGEYDMKVLLHYADKLTEKSTKINVNLDSIQPGSYLTGEAISQNTTFKRDSILLMVVIILIIINIGWFVYIRRLRKKNAE
jgi:hypothetical protein